MSRVCQALVRVLVFEKRQIHSISPFPLWQDAIYCAPISVRVQYCNLSELQGCTITHFVYNIKGPNWIDCRRPNALWNAINPISGQVREQNTVIGLFQSNGGKATKEACGMQSLLTDKHRNRVQEADT